MANSIEEFDEFEPCIVCGEPIDYCLGHGGALETNVWSQHEEGDHADCNPRACEEANQK